MNHMKLRALFCCLLAAVILAGCTAAPAENPAPEQTATAAPEATESPQATAAPEATQAPAETDAPAEERYPGSSAIDEMFGEMEQRKEDYAPQVITLDNGVRVQRTPNDTGGYWHRPGETTSYNTYYLDADNRGCAACHEDLVELLDSMTYEHLNFENGYGYDMNVVDCKICHTYGEGYLVKTNQFGSLIHGIHNRDTFTGDCMTCRNATEDGKGLILWEEAKYDVLQGITFLPDVQGEFSYEQDKLTSAEDMFFANWMSGELDYERNGADMAGVPLDQDLFDNWTISVTGCVDNPFTITLKELLEEAPSEKQIITNMCVMNPNGGPWLSNCEVTGVPFSYLFEKAGIRDTATCFMSKAPDGWARGSKLSITEEFGSYLVYEINGEPISWGQGYPVVTWNAGTSAPSYIRRVCEIEVLDVDPDSIKMFSGWYTEDGTYLNKPSAGIFNFQEGQIIEAGQPYAFEGYAFAFDQQVVAVEFSLDRGQTWTRFSAEGSDLSKWIYWHFTYTPEDPGAYVLSVRAETADGLVAEFPDEMMFNVE